MTDWNDREQVRAYKRERYAKIQSGELIPQRHRELNLDWENEEEVAAYQKAYKASWYQKNRESVIARATARSRTKEGRKSNRRASRKYYRTHKGASQEKKARRRARKIHAEVCDFTAQEWTHLKAAYNDRCAYCGIFPTQLTQDHLTPLSRGGYHTLHNIVPACKFCNSHKYTGPPLPKKLCHSLRSSHPSRLRLHSAFTHFLRAQALSNLEALSLATLVPDF